jgi:chitodextrinase
MKIRVWLLFTLVLAVASAEAQQTIYFKKDHIYNGPGGKEIAIVTPLPSDQTLPTSPSSLSSSNLSSTSVQLSWTGSTDSGGSGLAGYKIYRQRGTAVSLPVGTTGSGATSFTDQGLEFSTSYTYKIVSFDNAQNHSTPSGVVTITTLSSGCGADTTPPTIPTNVGSSLLARTTVQVTWSASSDPGGICSTGLNGYRVYRDGSLISGGTPITGLSYQDSNLAYKTTYSYTVVAVDNATNASAASAATSITTDWQLIFTDDFNRADNTSDLGNSNFFGNGAPWTINNLKAYVFANGWQEAVIATWQTDARLTMDVGTDYTGFLIWRGSQDAYRVLRLGGNIYLYYFPSWGALNGTILASGTATGGGTGTLRVQALSASRNIKVYWNNVLQIDYTETDTTRPNGGLMGISAEYAACFADNFMFEK